MRNKIYKIMVVVLVCVLTIKCINIMKTENVAETKAADTEVKEVILVIEPPTIFNKDNKEESTESVDDSVNDVIEKEEDNNIIEEEDVDDKPKYSEDEIYELAKIVMAEAEGESLKCKEYVAQTILNRVNSNKFPNTIHGVIFDGHQFSPTFDGRWEKVEPNQECYDAVNTVLNAEEPLTNALYFEACRGDSWHSRNLTQVAEISNTRFYID